MPARPFSPYAWRVRMALKHKGLDFETRPKPFTQIASIAPEVGKTVPILVDGERTICDSWAIATYLEETYADRPSLFGGPGGLACGETRRKLGQCLGERADRADDRQGQSATCSHRRTRPISGRSREERFGMSLEEVQAGREERLADLATALLPMHLMLKSQPFIGGDSPLQGDYMLFGHVPVGAHHERLPAP